MPPNWKDGFYNYAEAEIAYRMFVQYMKKSHYYGKSSGNWVKDDYKILLNIYGDLKENKFPLRKDLQEEKKL